MTKTETKLIRLAAVAAVIFFLMKRNGATRNNNNITGEKTEKWYPPGLSPEAVSARQRKMEEKYYIFEVDGITFYAPKTGEYSDYARAYGSNNGPNLVTYQGKTYKVLYSNTDAPWFVYSKIAPELDYLY